MAPAPSAKAKEQAAEKKAAEQKTKQEESKREAARKEKAEAEAKARQAKVASGDLIEGKDEEFEANTKETKVSGQVAEIISAYQASKTPLVFADVVETIGAKYPEDLIPAAHALETVGLLRRFDRRSTEADAGNRRSTAYVWVG